jgi:hypothetical protein
VVVWLVLLFPVGLVLMWQRRSWTTPVRWVVTALVAVLVIAGVGVSHPWTLLSTPSSASAGATPSASALGAPSPSASAPSSAVAASSPSPSPTTATVPALVGSLQATAPPALAAAGLQLGTVTLVPSSVIPVGMVMSQDPPAGSTVAPGTAVSLTVSSGPSASPTAVATAPTTPTPPATSTPTPTHTTKPTPTPKPTDWCGGPPNPLGYTLCPGGALIYAPAPSTCSYFDCIATFGNGKGYMVECQDGRYSMTGGRPSSCSHHQGEARPVYQH